ncbi:hypothetical protein V8J36_18830 [Frigidibacter sp. MR17.14]
MMKALGEQLHGYDVAGGSVLAKTMLHEGNRSEDLRFANGLRDELVQAAR